MPASRTRVRDRSGHRGSIALGLATIVSAAALGAWTPGATGAGYRPCGEIRGGAYPIKVYARPASMPCKLARSVARHSNPYGGKPDWRGWRCYHFTATQQEQGKLFGCTKGTRYVQARSR